MKKTLIYTMFVLIVLYFVEQVWQLPYITKTLIKLPLFTILPLLSLKGVNVKLTKKHTIKMVLVAITIFVVIVVTYITVESFIDFSKIQEDINTRMQISGVVLITTGLYTIFINSFIEELFFRGYVFGQLLKQSPKLAYVVSAFAFALYHVAIFKSWFSLPIFILALVGLFVGGLIFAYFMDKNKSFIASWLIHMAADVAIILIGWKLFFFV